MSDYPRVASLKTAAAFRAHLDRGAIRIAFDDELYYVSALLHDLGLTDPFDSQRLAFEVAGGDIVLHMPARRLDGHVTWTAPEFTRTAEPFTGDERAMLDGWLDWHRGTLLTKCAGLTGEQLAQRSVPPSTLSLLGLVRHMTYVESAWRPSAPLSATDQILVNRL